MTPDAVFPAIRPVRRRGRRFLLYTVLIAAGMAWTGDGSRRPSPVHSLTPIAAHHAAPAAHESALTWVVVAGLILAYFGTLAAVAIGYARTRVVIGSSDVTIHNLWTADRFPLDEVVGFEYVPAQYAAGLPYGRVQLRLTPREHSIPRSFPVAAMSPWRSEVNRNLLWRAPKVQSTSTTESEQRVDDMNAELTRRRPVAPDTEQTELAA